MKRSTLYIIILLAILIVLAIVAAIGQKQGWLGADKAEKVTVETVKQRDIVQTVTSNGKIHPEVEVKISSDVSGEVVELFIEEGDSVEQGEFIARSKPDSVRAAVPNPPARRMARRVPNSTRSLRGPMRSSSRTG